MKAHVTVMAALLVLLIITGCMREEQNRGPRYETAASSKTMPVYNFAVHPLHNPAMMMQAYQPLIEYLNKRLNGAQLILEASRDYAAYEKKYQERKPDFLLPNPWQTLQAIKSGYHVIAMSGEPADFKGLIIVRKDSAIKKPSDLKGKSLSYPAPTALAACIIPQYFLHNQGLDITKHVDNHFVGSQESSIMNVYLKKTAAGATWPPPWRAFQRDHPIEAAELKVMWETESLINNSVMVRNDIPVAISDQVLTLLTELQESDQGKAILANAEIARFIPASDSDYNVVRSYMECFERDVRKVVPK